MSFFEVEELLRMLEIRIEKTFYVELLKGRKMAGSDAEGAALM